MWVKIDGMRSFLWFHQFLVLIWWGAMTLTIFWEELSDMLSWLNFSLMELRSALVRLGEILVSSPGTGISFLTSWSTATLVKYLPIGRESVFDLKSEWDTGEVGLKTESDDLEVVTCLFCCLIGFVRLSNTDLGWERYADAFGVFKFFWLFGVSMFFFILSLKSSYFGLTSGEACTVLYFVSLLW